jgi:hypothetical protein
MKGVPEKSYIPVDDRIELKKDPVNTKFLLK